MNNIQNFLTLLPVIGGFAIFVAILFGFAKLVDLTIKSYKKNNTKSSISLSRVLLTAIVIILTLIGIVILYFLYIGLRSFT